MRGLMHDICARVGLCSHGGYLDPSLAAGLAAWIPWMQSWLPGEGIQKDIQMAVWSIWYYAFINIDTLIYRILICAVFLYLCISKFSVNSLYSLLDCLKFCPSLIVQLDQWLPRLSIGWSLSTVVMPAFVYLCRLSLIAGICIPIQTFKTVLLNVCLFS